MIAFIDDHQKAYGVEPICKVLPIAPSTYYAHAARRADPGRLPARARSDAALMVEIRHVFEENFHVYGVRKVLRQLGQEGIAAARCTVACLMRVMGLQGILRGRKVRTTIPDSAAPCPLNRVNRQFKAPRPNTLWVSDFTYVATWVGFVVPVAGRCPRAHRGMEVPLQRRLTSYGPGRLDASSLRRPNCHCPRACIRCGSQTWSIPSC